MKMKLHSILHQKGECHGLSKPQAQNGDSMEKTATEIHMDHSSPFRKQWSPLHQVPLGDRETYAKSESWCVNCLVEEVVMLSLLKVFMNLFLEGLNLFNQYSCMIDLSVQGICL
jgi:hypothetical protein